MEPARRINYLDFFRGISIINMIIYHTLYDLKYIFHQSMDFFDIHSWFYYQQYIVISFIFISGISVNYSKKLLPNSIRLFIISLLITLVTRLLIPSEVIYFGVLHFLSLSMFSIWLYQKVNGNREAKNTKLSKEFLLSFVHLLIFVLYRYFSKSALYDVVYDILSPLPLSFVIDFAPSTFYSADYVPLLPWIFLSFSGYFFGRGLGKMNFDIKTDSKMGDFVKLLGRNSLKIYLLHQIVIYAFLYILFALM
ncbi:MAG: heparan-alpha-glucosaminide N-acetyltransferase domain-containing protein [Peptostreptococcaceae bacterium]|nr:heparan-alpha-glucosaminide N-acetyltransferase domain-containing protein [Peptostreptococcaceae bacterium]